MFYFFCAEARWNVVMSWIFENTSVQKRRADPLKRNRHIRDSAKHHLRIHVLSKVLVQAEKYSTFWRKFTNTQLLYIVKRQIQSFVCNSVHWREYSSYAVHRGECRRLCAGVLKKIYFKYSSFKICNKISFFLFCMMQ